MSKFLNKKNKNYKQGIFNPKNPNKYKGTLPIIYRSGLELKSFRYLDNNPNVLTWGSESVIIPYQSPADGKIHRYFVDLVAALKTKNGDIKKLLIEVKPEKQTRPPTITNRKKQSTMIYEKYQWAINQAKWNAAKSWCASKNYLFIILNEKHLVSG
jgi:hypothetical protein